MTSARSSAPGISEASRKSRRRRATAASASATGSSHGPGKDEPVAEDLACRPQPLLGAGGREEPERDWEVRGDRSGKPIEAGCGEARVGEDEHAREHVRPVRRRGREWRRHGRPEQPREEPGSLAGPVVVEDQGADHAECLDAGALERAAQALTGPGPTRS
ncbi:MAG: hypothetical protein ABFC38_08520 [Methanospirillum sp.]